MRTEEEQSDLRNWIATVRDNNIPDGMRARVFDAGRLIGKDWPQAIEAITQLLDNADGSEACIPVCRAIAQTPPPRPAWRPALFKLLEDPSEAVRREAASALATDAEIAEDLVAMARSSETPDVARAAAVYTLGKLDDSYEAIAQLIGLLAYRNETTEQALYDALKAASAVDHVADTPEAWQEWWQVSQGLTRRQWLERALGDRRQQLESMQSEIDNLAARLALANEQRYRLSNGQRQALLKSFLEDQLEAIQLLGLDLVQEDIAEGRLPEGEILATLREALTHDSPRVRRGVLTILGHLRLAEDADALIAMLDKERSVSVRRAAIETLAKLANPAGITVLLHELGDAQACDTCRVAAARALGTLCRRNGLESGTQKQVNDLLLQQYALNDQKVELSDAIIAAMADISHPDFATVLVENLGHAKATIRRQCIASLADLDDDTHLPNILRYLDDEDAGVRMKAAIAVGALGKTVEHLTLLMEHLGEPDDQVREDVWASFLAVWKRQDIPTRVTWALNMDQYPRRQIEMLKTLESLQTTIPDEQQIRIFTELAERSLEFEQPQDALAYWDRVLALVEVDDAQARRPAELGRVTALLRTGDPTAITYARQLMITDPTYWPNLKQLFLTHLVRLQTVGRQDSMEHLGTEIRANFSTHIDPGFAARVEALINPEPPEAAPSDKPAGNQTDGSQSN